MSNTRGLWQYVSLFLFFLALGLALMVLQYKSANDTLQIATQAIQQAAVVDKYDLGSEKVRQELINQRIANDSKANMPTNLAAGLGALSAVLISLGGAILAIFGYLNEREKDRKALPGSGKGSSGPFSCHAQRCTDAPRLN